MKLIQGIRSAINAVLTGLSTATATAVTATDSILVAIGKLQGQFNALAPSYLTYSGGSQAYGVTTLAAVNSTTFTFPSTGLYHVQYMITHDANATTTGANFAVAGTAVIGSHFAAEVTYRVDGSTAGRTGYALTTFVASGGAGVPAQSSNATTNNRAKVDVWIDVATVGDISLLAASEVTVANGITVTAVTGFMKKEH